MSNVGNFVGNLLDDVWLVVLQTKKKINASAVCSWTASKLDDIKIKQERHCIEDERCPDARYKRHFLQAQ